MSWPFRDLFRHGPVRFVREVETMVRRVIGIAIIVWLMAGCASTTGQVVNEEEECNRNGGIWRTSLGMCDS
jgi:hypothetical protein